MEKIKENWERNLNNALDSILYILWLRMQSSLRGLILAYIFRIVEEVEALKAIMMDEVKVVTGDG